jgi:hypothetical protein
LRARERERGSGVLAFGNGVGVLSEEEGGRGGKEMEGGEKSVGFEREREARRRE